MPSIIGLDLGKHSFRAIEIDRTRKGNVVLHSGMYDNPKLNFEDESVESTATYAQNIREFISENNFSTSRVVIALEEKDVFMRVVQLPEMSDKELRSSIMYEAEQYIPLPLKDVNLSYQKLEMPNQEKGKMSVELVAAKKAVLQKYIDLAKQAKLTPLGLEPEALAVARSLDYKKNKNEALLILHFGFDKSLVIITLNGHVLFTRTLSIGGNTLTRAVEQQLSLDYVQAEEYKKTYGLNKDQAEGKIFDVLLPLFTTIVSELARAQVFFTTHNPNVNINRVILSGGTALMPGILFYMATNLNIEVELANPFTDLSFSKSIESNKEWHLDHGSLFSTSVGLALKEL